MTLAVMAGLVPAIHASTAWIGLNVLAGLVPAIQG